MRVYLSGPMTGHPDWNYPAFKAAAERLRALGHTVYNPADSDKAHVPVTSKAEFLRDDLALIAGFKPCDRIGGTWDPADAICLLPGWERSAGARMELHVALELGLAVFVETVPDHRIVQVSAETARNELLDAVVVAWTPRIETTTKTAAGTISDATGARGSFTLHEATSPLPSDKAERKAVPITSGVLDYFPAALAEVARVSKVGNDQHNPGQPLHHARGKSMDHADCVARHLIERGTIDNDGMRHTAKAAWRVLALLQEELEAEGAPLARAAKKEAA